jgi:hypothetical protein
MCCSLAFWFKDNAKSADGFSTLNVKVKVSFHKTGDCVQEFKRKEKFKVIIREIHTSKGSATVKRKINNPE